MLDKEQHLDNIQEVNDSRHALDEHAIDTRPLQTLMKALERHESSASSQRVLGQRGQDSPPEDVPGTYIDPHESAGLPGSNDTGAQAAHLIRAHTRKGRSLFSNVGSVWRQRKTAPVSSSDKHPVKARDFAAAAANNGDVEKDAGEPESKTPSGVLSALLTLYSDTPIDVSTPTSCTTLSSEPEAPEKPWVEQPSKDFAISRSSTLSNATSDSENSPVDNIGRTHTTASYTSLSFLRGGSRTPPIKSGVFGPLIASTGNLSGAAAPSSSQLQPNIKRPGYHLSRYSYEDAPLKTERSGKVRPKSAQLEIPSLGKSPTEIADTKSAKRWFPYRLTGGSKPTGAPLEVTVTDNKDVIDEKWSREKEKRRKRKKAEVFITRHVAQILQRQEFLLKFTRVMMMFGGPSHRLQSQLQSTARVLELDISCMYLPDVMLISFDDSSTATSQVKLIRQSSILDLGKLNDAYMIYWKVIHDDISVDEASKHLDALMRKRQFYTWWQLMLTGGMCSASICVVSFDGSFIDALMAFPMGTVLVGIQLFGLQNELYSNIFEITVATLFSFLSALLASTGHFCYSAITSGAIVMILPGFIVLCGSLEIMSRNIISGSVRMCYAVIYSLFLGLGLAMGGQAYITIFGQPIRGTTDYLCTKAHNSAHWYQRTPSPLWAFLTVPMFSFFLSTRNQTPWSSKEMFFLIAIACIGWVTNHFTATKFPTLNNMSSAAGAFAVGVVSNLCARFISGNAFVIMITGILFQVPSGLGSGGLLGFVSEQSSGSPNSYISGFETGLQIIFVGISLAVGLGISLFLTHPIPSRRRAGGIFSL